MNATRMKRVIVQALNAALADKDETHFTKSERAGMREALELILERPHGAKVLLLTRAEASALDHALGNSMDDGTDADVLVVGAHRSAAWRGREQIKRVCRKDGE